MIISLNWLKKYTDIDVSVADLSTLIGARLVEIEGVESLVEKYKDVIIVKVVECRPIEDTDHLNVTKVDDGGVTKDIERDENGLIQVVCGAPNVTAGVLVAWLPPTSTVPETYGDKEPFVLGARPLRGYVSNGMLASAKELALYEDHTGIIIVDKEVAPGTLFADAYELNDSLLDIENKSLTHRPDAFGVVGFAREIAGIQNKQFTTPEWLRDLSPTIETDHSVEAPKIIIDEPELSDRFSAIVLSGADEAAQSPLDIQTYLSRSGIRPISAIVDVTNYLMLLTGQPMHAYDYDKVLAVSGGVNEIHVRSAQKDETLQLIDGRELKLDTEDMVIAAGNVAIGLAGAMGGAATEIDEHTTRILLEVATFNLYKLRNIQMRHGIFTEAITRLTKGIPAPLSAPVLAEATRLLAQYAGAKVVSEVTEDYPGKRDSSTVTVTLAQINDVLGTQLTTDEVIQTLSNVECPVQQNDETLTVEIPYWRHDLSIAEDIIEEVGRLRGFDSIAVTLPQRDFTAVEVSDFDKLKSLLRSTLVRAGANEVLTYSFVHGDTMRKAGQNPEEAYRITNSISPELQYYRQSLTPSLLTAIHPNLKAGFDHFALFEINKFHTKRHGLTEENVPKELDGLAFVVAQGKKSESAAFFEAKQYLEYIAKELGVSFVYEPLEADSDYPVTQPFEPKRSARVWSADKTERIGVIGELKASVHTAFKLPVSLAAFEISPAALLKISKVSEKTYTRLSRFPSVERDISLQVPRSVTYEQLYREIDSAAAASELMTTIEPLDFYQPEDQAVKNLTFRLTFTSYDRTLTGDEVGRHMQYITELVTTHTNGKVL